MHIYKKKREKKEIAKNAPFNLK